MIEKAKKFAIHCHHSVNHFYDGHPYSFHLNIVVNVALRYIHLIPLKDRDYVISACWCHDIIEDTRRTYNDVKLELGIIVANIVYALTNEKGRTRKERANDRYYEGIRNTEYATFVKLCDRIANMEYSKNIGSNMYNMYKLENDNFINHIYDEKYDSMFEYLKSI